MRIARWSLAGMATLLALSFWSNKTPHSKAEIALLSDRLLEFGAVDFVHGFYEGPEQALFDCVSAGQVLSEAQSTRYRAAYQVLLLNKQSLFTRLDRNLQLREDEGMERPNNTGGHGIKGLHDHHDASANDNATDISNGLAHLETSWPLRRALIANDIYKDVTDLMVHMAPAVHSVGLLDHEMGENTVSSLYNPFYTAMKRAQAAQVNSPDYWIALEDATSAYAILVGTIETRVRVHNGAVLHALSGDWLSLQTIAPRLSAKSPSAKARKKSGANTPPCSA